MASFLIGGRGRPGSVAPLFRLSVILISDLTLQTAVEIWVYVAKFEDMKSVSRIKLSVIYDSILDTCACVLFSSNANRTI